ncbi:hypothetical protein [Microbacterium sp.]|uniref:hypothetical protein n=1 Tax=Microbacterium sp. TaxID=51671 RepID=UPI002FE06BD8
MRVLAFIGGLVAVTVLSAGSALLLATQAEERGEWFLLSGLAMTLFWVPPLVLASLLAFWDFTRSAGARRAYRRTLILMVLIQVIATVLLSAYVVLSRTPWWVVAAFVAVAIGLTAAAVKIGPVFRRTEGPSTLRAEGAVYTRADLRRDVRRIVVTGVAGLVVGAVGFGALFLVLDDGDVPVWWMIGAGLFCAVLAAGVAVSFIVWRLARQQRDLLDGDVERGRTIGKVVIRGKKIVLSAEDEAIAPRYAAISAVSQAYTLVQLATLLVAIGGSQLARVIGDPTDTFTLILVCAYVLLFVALVPMAVIQLCRTRTYARDHGELIIEQRGTVAAPSA